MAADEGVGPGRMRLTVIGCSGSFPGPDSPASCYLLEAEGPDGSGGERTWRILLDLGSGALGVLQRYADVLAVDGVFLSHLHADHCLDLCGYYVLRRYHPSGRAPQIPVWGPEGTAGRMARAYDLEPEPGMGEEFDFRAYDGTVSFGPFTVEAHRVAHPVLAYALRITDGDRVLAYSGDTGPCGTLEKAAHDADLFLAEAAFVDGRDNPPDLHLTGSQAGLAATRAGARRLVLTHVPAWHDPEVARQEARGTYDGPIDLARTGAVFEI